MRNGYAVLLGTVVLCGAVAIANEKPTQEYQDAMKSNGATAQVLRMHIMAKDYPAIEKDAATLKANFAKVEAFWTPKQVVDAITFGTNAAKASADLETAAKAKSDDQIAAANLALTSTCVDCHRAHRERLPDMTFEIK